MSAASRDDQPSRRKPSRSGADTWSSTDIIRPGGKVDPAALKRAIDDQPTPQTDDAEQIAPAAPDDDAPNRVVFVLQRDLQSRLDKYLSSRISFMSRNQLQRLIDEGGVTVNARKPKSSTVLRTGDRIEVFVPPPPSTEVQPEDIPLIVLHEDAHLIVLNKSPDIIVHPARAHNSGTLINALAFHFQNRSPVGGALSQVGREFARPGVVHRLDRQTSGLIVFAKDDESHWKIGRQFEQRTVDKRYLALVHGQVVPPIDVIDFPLGPHPSKEKGYREKYVVRHDALGKPSITICRVRAMFEGAPVKPGESSTGRGGGFSLVELELKTGRTHQIRVHLSHLGYPIVGDDMYGGRPLATADLGLPGDEALMDRQALHAATLAFRHPLSNEPLAFSAPLPDDMVRTIRALVASEHGAGRTVHILEPPPPGATVTLDSGILSAP